VTLSLSRAFAAASALSLAAVGLAFVNVAASLMLYGLALATFATVIFWPLICQRLDDVNSAPKLAELAEKVAAFERVADQHSALFQRIQIHYGWTHRGPLDANPLAGAEANGAGGELEPLKLGRMRNVGRGDG